jgi:hypothetical protein
MPNRTYRVCLPPSLGQHVEEVALSTGQSISGIIRKCVALALDSPEMVLLLHAEGSPVEIDGRTPEQRQRWIEHGQHQGFDPANLVVEGPLIETDARTAAQRQRWAQHGQSEGFDPAFLVIEHPHL